MGHSILLVAKGICPAAQRGTSPGPASPLTEASPSSQRLPACDQGLWLMLHSHPNPNRQFHLSGHLGTSWKHCPWSNSPPWVIGATHRMSSGRPQTLHPGEKDPLEALSPTQNPNSIHLSSCLASSCRVGNPGILVGLAASPSRLWAGIQAPPPAPCFLSLWLW